MKKIFLVFSLLLVSTTIFACKSASALVETTESNNQIETSEEKKQESGNKMGGGMRAGMDNGLGAKDMFLDDAAKANLEKAYNEVKDKFSEFVYKDEATGLELTYGLFVPEGYESSSEVYPLIMFIGDASTTKNTVQQMLENCYGSVVWATNKEQEKHKSFVLVPTYKDTLIDDNGNNPNVSVYMDVTKGLINYIESNYRIDTNKVYSTGQSMGAMSSLYLTANNPDLFTATLLVDGQWDISEIQGIKDRKFFYFAASGDEKAFAGQTEVKNYLKENNVNYAEVYDVDAKADADTLNKVANELFDKGFDKNFLTWKLNSTYINGVSNGSKAGEHMTSFYYGYNIERVRDWLFEQSKTSEK